MRKRFDLPRCEPLIFLDYFATGKLNIENAENIIGGIAKGCEFAGCALIGGETAEMPKMYHGEDFDLAGFSVGAVERGQELPRSTSVGDVIIGLSSNGIHSNGYSLVRKIVEKNGLKWSDDASFDDKNLGDALLTPTKIYVKQCRLLKNIEGVKALAHITGGGLTENILRALVEGQGIKIDLSTWKLPPIFTWLSTAGNVSQNEMLKTFNCGMGMTVICSRSCKDEVFALLEKNGENPTIIGEVTETNKVHYCGNLL